MFYPSSSWFLPREQERNQCKQPFVFPLSMHKFFKPHVSRVAIGLLENRISTWQLSAELRVELPALKWFQIVPEKHRKRDVTTVFAYSHVNTPIDQ